MKRLNGDQHTIDAAALGALSATEEHSAGVALSYSTVATTPAAAQGRP